MLGDRRLGETQMPGQLDHAMLAEAQVPHDRQARRIRQAVEQRCSRRQASGLDLAGIEGGTLRGFHRHTAMLSESGVIEHRRLYQRRIRIAIHQAQRRQT